MFLRPLLFAGYCAGRVMGAAWRRVGQRLSTEMHRATLGSVGRGTVFQTGVRFSQPQVVSVGDCCRFETGCAASADFPGGTLLIEDGVQINRDVHIDITGGLMIGAGSLVSEGAVIYTHDHGLDPRSAPAAVPKTIGRDVWIGMRAVILPKCRHIGPGAVVGAGAVVVADVPANAIVAGNPARVVRYRNTSLQVVA